MADLSMHAIVQHVVLLPRSVGQLLEAVVGVLAGHFDGPCLHETGPYTRNAGTGEGTVLSGPATIQA
jgi:hypothetical protein